MSELHTYRIHWSDPRTGSTGTTNEPAFTADDALTQHRLEHPERKAYRVEPLLDSREPTDASPRREWATIPVAGRLVTERDEAREDTRRFEHENIELHAAIFGHALGSITHEQAVAEAERLRAEVQTLKFERDHSRHAAADHFAEVRALIDAIEGRPDPGNHIGPDLAARMARETREERDRLRGRVETQVAELKRLRSEPDEAREVAQTRLDALCKIGRAVWPEGASRGYALDELVEAVQRLRQERDTLGRASLESDGECMRLRAERDALAAGAAGADVVKAVRHLQDQGDAVWQALSDIADLVWPENKGALGRPKTLADLVEAVRKMGAERESLGRDLAAALEREKDFGKLVEKATAERDAARKKAGVEYALKFGEQEKLRAALEVLGETRAERDALKADLEAVRALHQEACGQRDVASDQRDAALKREEDLAVGMAEAQKARDEVDMQRDGLQARIDAAKAHLTGANLPHGSDLLAILEGREP